MNIYSSGVNIGDTVTAYTQTDKFVPTGYCQWKNTTPGLWKGQVESEPKMLGEPLGIEEKPAETMGCPAAPASPPPSTHQGNPINAATGNKVQTETDVSCAPHTGLRLARTYNSQDRGVFAFGAQWRDAWHRGLTISATTITVTRADGRRDKFTKNGTTFTADPDVTSRLTAVLSGATITAYKLTTAADVTETYSPTGRLLSITARNGQTTTLTYTGNNLTRVTGPFGHVMSFTYTGGGQVATVTGPDGGLYRYGYDSSLNLISVTYPDGAMRRYVYEIAAFPHLLTGIIDENGTRYARWTYDPVGRAISSQHAGGVELTRFAYTSDTTSATVTDARGNAHTYGLAAQFNVVKPTSLSGTPLPSLGGKAFAYDANGFLARRTDYDGNITTYTHDARGNETSRTEASGTPLARTISTTWHPTFHLPAQITEPNRVTTFTYDARGNLRIRTVTAGALTRRHAFTYDARGQLLTATDPRGKVTRYAYDAAGNLASVTNALGQVTSFTSYDGAGRLLRAVDPNGLVTTLTYDPRGRLKSRTEGALTTSFVYDRAGNLTRLTLPDASFLTFTYDPAHRLTRITDRLGNHIDYTLDAASNRTREEAFDPANALKRTRSYAYDAVNRLSRMIGARGQTTAYAYDAQSNLTRITDPLNHANSYSYDALNRLARAVNPAGGATSVAYDANDHLVSVTDPRALTTSYAWDALDNQTALTSPDTGVTQRIFDAAGNVLTSTDARGKRTIYAYDALNRRISAIFADGKSIAWRYDQGTNGIGRLTGIADATGSISYSYDANGRLTRKQQVTGAVTLTTLYAYDALGRLASTTYPSGKRILYAYDAAGRVTSLKAGAQTLIAGVAWQPFGATAGWTAGNGAAYGRSFDQDGRVSGLTLPAGVNIALAYDAASRITGITETGLPAKSFGYDALDRLTGYTAGTVQHAYGYDVDGNRISARLINGATNNLFRYAYPASSNRLASISGAWAESFTYDAAGNTTAHSSPGAAYTFTYDARGRLAKSTTGALSKTYGVNGLGQRVLKADPANANSKTIFVYDEAGHLVGEYGPTGTALAETVWLGDLPVSVLQGATTSYIGPDHLGSPHQITNAGKAVIWSWDHDPFGNGAPNAAAGVSNNLRFPGQYSDQETGLHYNYFRDYDPRIGRYLQSDPIGLGGGVNLYAYVRNNPSELIDMYGLFTLEDAEKSLQKRGVRPDEIDFMTSRYSSSQIFDEWLRLEKSSMAWVNELPPCPKRLEMCKSPAWNKPTPANPYHTGGVSEVRSATTNGGHSNQCVYDANNILITTIPAAGSADFKACPSPPFCMGHVGHDVLPYMKAMQLNRVGDYYAVRPIK